MSRTLFDALIGRTVRRGRLEIRHADGTIVRFGTAAPGCPDVAVRFTDARVPRDILMDLALGAAEAFMDGRLVIERGDVMELAQLLRMNARWDEGGRKPRAHPLRRLANRAAFTVEQVNRQMGARSNVAHHYDIGNALYRLMLDAEHMQYSCAYWPREDMTLAEAQEAKLAHIAAKLALRAGDMVLDIGCGWGGMAIYLARHFDVRVHGITLSAEQLALARERAEEAGVADRITFELIDYRDLPARQFRYDRIVSVGMFEHVGRPQFATFFRTCASLLEEDGVMLLHTIGRMGSPGTTDAFTRKYIFPGGYIPALSETVVASEHVRLIAADVETWRLHYARTLRAWYANCQTHREAITALFDERFFRMWTFYLAGATAAFESGAMCNYQIQYVRRRDALPLTRDYMIEAERALLGS
ncbi:methyltransferase domain-containing protein [Erythrobacteraceae bacterium CFH 75059]|uniref:class I SAM-dependent methyltransferase n=1 Tax=Qipengyuania thermophila TaxID=2509361 RepID=UPI00101F6112|nr:class I SAM-dependent methyltransferase [Qipengyuania thermophila]TCD05430.1 methyltransferase domain-containing protein [Erythrobacteraceae bacterium CFH 75059]